VTVLDQPAPVVGEVLKIHDRMTGFSPDAPKENRPYVVIEQAGRFVRVVPQSTLGETGVYIPADAVEGLEEGWFVPWSALVRVRDAIGRPVIGYLPGQYLEPVLDQWRGRRRQ
jgi:hypothetical protein